MSRRAAEGFIKTPEGKAWLERKIAEKNASRPEPGPGPEQRTKFPFKATINDEEVVVWPDWIERPATPLYEPDYEEDYSLWV